MKSEESDLASASGLLKRRGSEDEVKSLFMNWSADILEANDMWDLMILKAKTASLSRVAGNLRGNRGVPGPSEPRSLPPSLGGSTAGL